jgi:hypothetical protein
VSLPVPDVTPDRSLVPGALQVYKQRMLPDGSLIEFESSPYGWLTKKGELRKRDYRAYYYTPPRVYRFASVVVEPRKRCISVTTLLDAIIPKGGLPPWSEARGIEGLYDAFKLGYVTLNTPRDRVVSIVRSRRLGADRARDDAADRGLDIHGILEEYMKSSTVPSTDTILPARRGYFQALCKWLSKVNPEPERVEELVCHAQAGYAGRSDLVARVGGNLRRYDAKTQENAGIFEGAHAQCVLYEEAATASGDDPCDELWIVVFAENGEYREMRCAGSSRLAESALAFAAEIRPVAALCARENAREKKARA